MVAIIQPSRQAVAMVGRRSFVLLADDCIIVEAHEAHQCHPSRGQRDKCHPLSAKGTRLGRIGEGVFGDQGANPGGGAAIFCDVVTNSEHSQKINNAATGAASATLQAVQPLPRTTSVESRVFGIRNKHINDKIFQRIRSEQRALL
jgi:hypothetical protein